MFCTQFVVWLVARRCNWRRTGVICSVRVLGTAGEQSSFEHTVVYRDPIVVTLAYRREFQKSSFDEIKAWTSISVSFWGRQFRILAIVLKWKSNVTPILGKPIVLSTGWTFTQWLALFSILTTNWTSRLTVRCSGLKLRNGRRRLSVFPFYRGSNSRKVFLIITEHALSIVLEIITKKPPNFLYEFSHE